MSQDAWRIKMRSPLKLKLGSPLRTWGVGTVHSDAGRAHEGPLQEFTRAVEQFPGRRSTRGRYTVLRNEGLRALSRCQWGRGHLGAGPGLQPVTAVERYSDRER